jgi:hypothetical protein
VLWRRPDEFITLSPGCRQSTILALAAAWHYCPAAGLLGLGTFWNKVASDDLMVERGIVSSDATNS